jgi:hypothetical protein
MVAFSRKRSLVYFFIFFFIPLKIKNAFSTLPDESNQISNWLLTPF